MTQILGNGIYASEEAARIIGVSQAKVVAWFRGWDQSDQTPLLKSDYAGEFERVTISFLDLVDTAVAATLREKHKVSTHTIRLLRTKLARLWNTQHPFSRQEFFTDETGQKVFCTIACDIGENDQLLDILEQQFTLPTILLPFLKRVEYNRTTRLAQVMPLTESVVIDPRRRFGAPIVRGTGMPTRALYESYLANDKTEDRVADWYNVTPDDVVAAVEFETGFTGIAA